MAKLIFQFDTISGVAVVDDYLVLWDDSANQEVKILLSAFPSNVKVALLNAVQTWEAAQNLADNEVRRPELKDPGEAVEQIAASGAAQTLDLETAGVFEVTLDANCTLTFDNPPASGRMGRLTLFLVQDGVGSRTVTWPASVKWPAGTAPVLATDPGQTDVLTFMTVDGGTTWFGVAAGGGAGEGEIEAPVTLVATPDSLTEGNSTVLSLSDETDVTEVDFYTLVSGERFDIATVSIAPFQYAWEPDEGIWEVFADITYATGTVTTDPVTVTVTL